MTNAKPPPHGPRSSDIALAARLQVMDRWPTIVETPLLWDRMRCIEAFDYRWHERDVPPRVQQWYDRMDEAAALPPVLKRRRALDVALAGAVVGRGLPITDVNLGRGGRRANSLMVAAAVDSHLNGAPATALGWAENKDAVRVLDVATGLGAVGIAERAVSAAEVDRIVRSWGPGGKGVLSLRDPASVFLWVINAVNRDGTPEYYDYSYAVRRSRTGRIVAGQDAATRANHLLDQVDPRSSFASVALWRTANLAHASRLPDGLFEATATGIGAVASTTTVTDSVTAVRSIVDAALPPSMPPAARVRAIDRICYFADQDYALWLVEQLWRGALTLLPTDLAALSIRRWSTEAERAPDPLPLTRLDQIVLSLAQVGHLRMMGPHLELAAPDTVDVRRVASEAIGGSLRDQEIDGIAARTVELWLDPWAQMRLHEDNPTYEPPTPGDVAHTLSAGDRSGGGVAWRGGSWIDVNRVPSPGQRRTNCWNCVAATANWIESRSRSTALPIYDEESYRPTIPDFLQQIGALGKPEYVTTKTEAEACARSWGANRQGLVICSLTKDSTHIFNVIFDGDQVRFLDSHLGRDGDYNFDTDWMRIGVVALDRGFFLPTLIEEVRCSPTPVPDSD